MEYGECYANGLFKEKEKEENGVSVCVRDKEKGGNFNL